MNVTSTLSTVCVECLYYKLKIHFAEGEDLCNTCAGKPEIWEKQDELLPGELVKCIECHALKDTDKFYLYDAICKECFRGDTTHPFHQNPE